MKIFDSVHEAPPVSRGVALGFFDGLHRGHMDLIRTLLFSCAREGLTASAFTFRDHPGMVLADSADFPGYISSLDERLMQLQAAGLDEVIVQSFDRDFAGLDPLVFLDDLMAGQLNTHLIVVGPDFHFGVQGSGDVALLRHWARTRQIEVMVVDEVRMDDAKVSSTRIRTLIQQGQVDEAASLLGRPYCLSGQVISGRGLGRRLGFPTANMAFPARKCCPAYGVYATSVRAGNRTYEGITNIGLRPTVENGTESPVIETYLFDADLPLYGQNLEIGLLKRLRPEIRFSSLLQLGAQISQDLDLARQWHRQAEKVCEVVRVGDIPVFRLYSERFAHATAHLVFEVEASPDRLPVYALLMQVLSAACCRYPGRTAMAMALDSLYGASLEGGAEKAGNVQILTLTAEGLVTWTDGSSPFQDVCRLLFDVLLDPWVDDRNLFDADLVASERSNLLTALAARQNDRGKYAYDRCIEAFCAEPVYGMQATGSAEALAAVTLEDLRDAYRDLVSQADAALYLGGRIDAATLDLCSTLLEKLPSGRRAPACPGILPAPCPVRPASSQRETRAVEQARIVLAYSGLPPYFSHQSPVILLLNSMLGGDVHSLLFDVVREKMGLAYQVYSAPLRYLSALVVMAGVAPESVEQALAAIAQQIRRLAEGDFDDQLMDRSRKLLESAIASQGDDLSAMLSSRILGKINGRLLERHEALALLRGVTRSQIVDSARQLRLTTSFILTEAGAPDAL